MSAYRLVPRATLPVTLTGSRAPIWWAMLVFVTIEATVFATFLSSYFYLRFRAAEWPPPGFPVPDLLLPIVNTVILLASGVVVLWASNAIRNGHQRRLKIGLAIGIVLETVFFAIKLVMAMDVPYGWSEHAYGSIFLTIDRVHTFHVFTAILMASAILVLAVQGYFTRERRIGVQVVNIYWQFVALVWIPVFVVLYLVPRWW